MTTEASDIPAGFEPMPSAGGFEDMVGPIYMRRDENGAYRLAFRARADHANPRGVVHGGMLMTLSDTVLGMAVWRAVGNKPCATISFNCHFVAGARPGDWIEANAEIVRRGRSVVFMRGEILAGDRLLGAVEGVWKVLGE